MWKHEQVSCSALELLRVERALTGVQKKAKKKSIGAKGTFHRSSRIGTWQDTKNNKKFKRGGHLRNDTESVLGELGQSCATANKFKRAG